MTAEPRRTLYVSDLDGTLLRSDGSLSPYTVRRRRGDAVQIHSHDATAVIGSNDDDAVVRWLEHRRHTDR